MRIKPLVPFVIAGLLIIVATITGCTSEKGIQPTSSAGNGSPAILTISGAGGAARVLSYLAEQYSAKYSDLDFQFLPGSGSGGGVKGVVAGTLDLGTMSRMPKDSEMDTGISHLAFAYDPVVIAVSNDIAIDGLSSEQVKDIFLGNTTNWADVGGPDSLITVLTREEDDSNTKIVRNGIVGDTDFARGSHLVTSEDELKKTLAKLRSSIGYLAYSGVQLDALDINVLELDGLHPSDADEYYPLDNRLLGVAYLPASLAKVQPFLDFITGDEGARFLSDKGIPSIN